MVGTGCIYYTDITRTRHDDTHGLCPDCTWGCSDHTHGVWIMRGAWITLLECRNFLTCAVEGLQCFGSFLCKIIRCWHSSFGTSLFQNYLSLLFLTVLLLLDQVSSCSFALTNYMCIH